ncbi:MAG: hypothetical protein NZM04_06160 [Methylacidiphilales bacterium]|nr:hypothetical protein [Candidatus Methylacidiphilales bacterium]
MDVLQIILIIVGLILMFASGAIGHLITSRRTTRAVGHGIKSRALPKINITWLDVIYAGTMITGIMAGEIWDSIQETGAIGFNIPRFIGALIASPIVYAGVYSKFVKDELSLPGLCIAFQNGFFWQAFFETARVGQ